MFDNKERKKCKYWSFLDSIFKPRTMNIAVGTFLSNYLDFIFTDHSGENKNFPSCPQKTELPQNWWGGGGGGAAYAANRGES